ncbi:MAG TPA: M28 family metallopeptidase [Candidatus Eremiobacteraceae bacterium]
MIRSFICAGLLAVAVCASATLPSVVAGSAQNHALAAAAPQSGFANTAIVGGAQPADCENRVNDTLAKLDACMTPASLWRRLSHFQTIADQNPGPDGHGTRDTGTAGYKASVDFVAELMRQAGYRVKVQSYIFFANEPSGTPRFGTASYGYTLNRDWLVARRSGSGSLTAPFELPTRSPYGCFTADFAGFTRGDVAVIQRGECAADRQVANAQTAGARAVILYTTATGLYAARLNNPANIPVIGASGRVGMDLLGRYRSGRASTVHIDIQMRLRSGTDYNLIADSPFGDANHIVAIDAHLDSIFGAGMLDNASGSASILETALDLANTPTLNRLRYIWFGGEELGLLGSAYYTTHLTSSELHRIVFDVDADVTATPNFDMEIADPAYAENVGSFPANVVPESKVGNDAFAHFFKKIGIVSEPAPFGNSGTDSNSFALVGVPDSGILTRQDCCKDASEVQIWGGFTGNYEGNIPSFDGGCVDMPDLWCDNLSNNDPFVLGLASKSIANVTLTLANDASLTR